MLRFLADENFNRMIIEGVLRFIPHLDMVRVQDVGLCEAPDEDVLEWAASEGRVILTHDVSTMSRFAYKRVASGLPMPGVFEVPSLTLFKRIIEDIVLIAEGSVDGEWEGQVRHLPLQ